MEPKELESHWFHLFSRLCDILCSPRHLSLCMPRQRKGCWGEIITRELDPHWQGVGSDRYFIATGPGCEACWVVPFSGYTLLECAGVTLPWGGCCMMNCMRQTISVSSGPAQPTLQAAVTVPCRHFPNITLHKYS